MNGSPVQSAALPTRVRFKYQFGELSLGVWAPSLIPLEPKQDEISLWPRIESLPPILAEEVDGYQLRRAAVNRFPRGISIEKPWLCYSPRKEQHYFVDIVGTFEDYLKRRSVKSRQNLRRSVNRFLDSNAEALVIAAAPEEMEGFHQQAVAISRKTYQQRLLGAGLPDTPEFLNYLKDKASKGGVLGYILRYQGTPIAFALCLSRGDKLVYEIIGYLPEHSERSPGTVLLYLILQDLFSHGKFPLLDFGPGQAFYKESFATGQTEYAESYLLHDTWGNFFRLALHWRIEQFSSAVGAILERFGVKKRIRLAIRSIVGRVKHG